MIYSGDCLEVMRTMPDNSVDAVITDPPYGLSFMGKKWDYDVPSVEIWKECLRVLKHGGYLLSFAGTRTQHRMAVNIEDAGFEIRDMIAWVYGSGFPKSLNIGKVMDKFIKTGNASWNGTGDSSNGALGYSKLQHQQGYRPADYSNKHQDKSEITEDKAKEWEGWGTALKPALEPITVARKPLEKGLTVAENCLKWGVGGINIDGCRVGTEVITQRLATVEGGKAIGAKAVGIKQKATGETTQTTGRFPANIIHDGSQEVLDLFPNTKSVQSHRGKVEIFKKENSWIGESTVRGHNDSGSAARFFYCAKASKAERNRGCEGLEEKLKSGTEFRPSYLERYEETGDNGTPRARFGKMTNNHPTVKPITLMEYLVKLVTREGQIVLDPFAGSGTTGIACKNLNREAILIERETEYVEIAECRVSV